MQCILVKSHKVAGQILISHIVLCCSKVNSLQPTQVTAKEARQKFHTIGRSYFNLYHLGVGIKFECVVNEEVLFEHKEIKL